MPNRLATATSPYLLQHADNPVDWWEWSDEAFAEAARRDVPVLLSRRLRRLPLVPRHGARVVRGRGHRRADQRRVRRDQGGPRGAAGHRRGLHGGHPGHDRAGRLADDLLPHPGRGAVLLRHVLPAGAPARDAVVPPAARRGEPGLAGRRRAGAQRGRGDRGPAGGQRRGRVARRPDSDAGRARRVGASLGGDVRRAVRRVRRGAEVPAVDGAGVPAAPARAHRVDRRRCVRWR